MEAFPQEMIDALIEQVDHEALAACSLVCHAWRAPSIRRLFKRKTIGYDAPALLLGRFTTWITDTPHIGKHITHFALLGARDIPIAELVLLLSNLPRLQDLTLNDLTLLGGPLESLPSLSPSVLALLDVQTNDDDLTVTFVLNLFPNLQELRYRDQQLPRPSSKSLELDLEGGRWPLQKGFRLRRLHLTGSTPLTPYFERHVLSCTTLVLGFATAANIEVFSNIGRLIDKLSSTLVNLHFLYTYGENPHDFEWLNLRRCTSLRSVSISLGNWVPDPHIGVVEILKRVPPTCQCIGVALPLEREFHKLPHHVKQMRPALASVTRLQRLVFGYVSYGEKPPVPLAKYEATVRRILKEYDEKSILEWQNDFDLNSCSLRSAEDAPGVFEPFLDGSVQRCGSSTDRPKLVS